MIPWVQFVVGNILVASLIGALAWQVGRRGRHAFVAHLLWVVVFVKLITPPIVLLPIPVPESWLPATQAGYANSIPYQGITVLRGQSHASEFTVGSVDRAAAASPRLTVTTGSFVPRLNAWTVVVMIWLVGSVVVLLRGTWRFVRFGKLLARAGTRDDEATAFVHNLLKQVRGSDSKPHRSPTVLRLPVRVSPMLFGFGYRAYIVCPDQLWHLLSERERHAFLAHETAHFCRRDHWVRWLEWVVTAAYWWFPGVYFARRQLERHEEACCDAWAVDHLEASPRHYAETLLRVVDFISDHHVGIPRLASGMQPTDSLEERLRLLIQRGQSEAEVPRNAWTAGAMCFSLWLIHPVPGPSGSLHVRDNAAPATRPIVTTDDEPQVAQVAVVNESELPDPPRGFWNHAPRRTWANFALKLPGAQLVAAASDGISIQVPGHATLRFDAGELTALTEIPTTSRLVIGDREGRIRLWDLDAGMPVSLIGQHAGPVTSMAYHESAGLIAGDNGGSVMRWDLQSGQVLATWSGDAVAESAQTQWRPAPIQSVRYSADGATLAILTGCWDETTQSQRIHLVDSQTLETIRTVDVHQGVAVAVQSRQYGWLMIDWSGAVHTIDGQLFVANVDKHRVSALVLSSLAGPIHPDETLN